jgi:protein SCO1
MILRACVTATLLCLATHAQAHDGKLHKTPAEAAAHAETSSAGLPLPFDLGGPFALIDQNGQTRTEADPNGNLQLLFFGYGSCREICSAALPQMAEVASGLAAKGVALTPVLITVDPVRDTVATLGPSLEKFGPLFVGLTGDGAALRAAYKAFSIDSSLVFDDPTYGAVYAHGSFLYLLDAKGGFLTVIPPILSTDRVVDLIATYAP